MPTKNYLAFYKLSFKQIILSLFYFLLLVFLYRTESILKIGTHYLGTDQADGGLYVWLFKSNLNYLWELPWFNTKAFYPYTLSLAWSDNFILPAIIAKPFVELGLPIIVAYNLVLLTATFLNGFLTFKVAYQLSKHFLGSLIAGTIFLGLPFFVLHLGHPQLQFAFWIPLAFGLFCKFLYRPKVLTAVLLGLSIFLSFLTTVYFTIFIIITLILFTIALIVYQKSFFKLNNISKALIGTVIGMSPIIPFVLPYLEVKETYGSRDLIAASAFGAKFKSYLTAPESHSIFDFTAKWSHAEAQLFPGTIALLGLIIVIISLSFKKPRNILPIISASFLLGISLEIFQIKYLVWFYWLVFFGFIFYLFIIGRLARLLRSNFISNQGLVACLLFTLFGLYFFSLGPIGQRFQFFDTDLTPQGLHAVFYHLLPGVSAIRAVSRIGIFVAFFLALIIPFACHSLFNKKLKRSKLILVGVLILAVLEGYPKYYPLENEHPPIGIFTELNQHVANNDVVIALPMTTETLNGSHIGSWGTYATTSINYQNWLIDQPVYLVNGYSGQHSRNAYTFPGLMQKFPNQESLDQLGLISNLKWIIYSSGLVNNFDQETFETKIFLHQERLEIITKDNHGNYLIKFKNHTPLTKESYFQVPSYPINQKLEIALKASTPEPKEAIVKLFVKKYAEKYPWEYLKLQTDGTWQKFVIKTPVIPDQVRPVFIRFESDVDLILGDNKFISE